MSSTSQALLVKFLLTLVIAWVTIGLFDSNRFGLLLLYTVVATVGNYIIGDLMILPAMKNTVASVADGLMAAFIAWTMGLLIGPFRTTFLTLMLLALLIGICEFFFHKYLKINLKVAP